MLQINFTFDLTENRCIVYTSGCDWIKMQAEINS